jgi:signal transduction histidine kinase
VSTAVLIVVVAAAVGSAYLAKRVVDDQEQRLLHERTAEIASLFGLAIGSVQASLGSVAAVASATNADPTAFKTHAKKLLVSKSNASGYTSLALVRISASGPTLVTSVGTGVTAARLNEPAVLRTLARANPTGFASTPVLGSGNNLRLGYVVGPPMSAAGFVVYAEQALAPYAGVDAARDSATPFSELIGAIYASSRPDPSQLLVSSVRTVPLRGDVGRETIKVGPDQWLIEVQPRDSLVGGVARLMPWMLFALGVALALVMTAVVEVLGRRRRYAEGLVAERTQELRDSLDQLERAQQQLVLSERLAAIGQVASTVGHELRNPLGVMANAVYLLRLGTDDPTALRQLDTLDREVHSAARISSDLLDFARTRPPDWAPVDLHELVTECLAVALCPAGIEVVRDEDDGLYGVRADRDQLRQVLLNLLINAYDAVPDGGTVTISTQRLDGAVRIEVADDGAGIDEATTARLFEPFFTTKTRGTGLGLAVSKRLVEGHSGSISVTTAPGQGARFSVVLPLISATPRTAPDPETAEPAGASS